MEPRQKHWSKNWLVMPGLNQKNTALTVCVVPKHLCILIYLPQCGWQAGSGDYQEN